MSEKMQSMRDRVRARAAAHKNQGGMDCLILPDGVDFFKPEKGVSEFDIIPYQVTVDNHPEVKKGESWYQRSYLVHRNVGAGGDKSVVCPRTVGKRCPICEEYQRLSKDPQADEEVVKGLRAKERELFNVVMKDGDGSVMILDMSIHLFGLKLEQEILEGDDSNASFAELKGGKTLKVRWEQKTMGTNKFVEAGRIDFNDREDYGKEVLEAAVDLDKALKILSYEEIESLFQSGGEEKGEENPPEEAQEEKPTRRVVGANRKPSADEEEDNIPMDKKASPDADGEPSEDAVTPPDEDSGDCIACEGSGKTSKGKVCPICDGTGKNEPEPKAKKTPAAKAKPEAEPEEQEEEQKPTARRVVRR